MASSSALSAMYEAVPICLEDREIRLIQIAHEPHISRDSLRIRCKLASFPLSKCPPYIALSYTWGLENNGDRIVLEGTEFAIGKNLYGFLHHMRDSESLFWIDAICINQVDTRERNHQVDLMKDIYSFASQVTIWLGDNNFYEHAWFSRLDAWSSGVVAKAEAILEHRAWLPHQVDHPDGLWTAADGAFFLSICQADYWNRVWIVQEVMCAKKLLVDCGPRSFDWECLNRIFQVLKLAETQSRQCYIPRGHEIWTSPAAAILRAKVDWTGPMSLVNLIDTYRHLHSTDVRDKVFGLLGLASRDLPLDADYSMTKEELFEIVLTRADRILRHGVSRDSLRFGRVLREVLRVSYSDDELKMLLVTSQHHRSEPRGSKFITWSFF